MHCDQKLFIVSGYLLNYSVQLSIEMGKMSQRQQLLQRVEHFRMPAFVTYSSCFFFCKGIVYCYNFTIIDILIEV